MCISFPFCESSTTVSGFRQNVAKSSFYQRRLLHLPPRRLHPSQRCQRHCPSAPHWWCLDFPSCPLDWLYWISRLFHGRCSWNQSWPGHRTRVQCSIYCSRLAHAHWITHVLVLDVCRPALIPSASAITRCLVPPTV